MAETRPPGWGSETAYVSDAVRAEMLKDLTADELEAWAHDLMAQGLRSEAWPPYEQINLYSMAGAVISFATNKRIREGQQPDFIQPPFMEPSQDSDTAR